MLSGLMCIAVPYRSLCVWRRTAGAVFRRSIRGTLTAMNPSSARASGAAWPRDQSASTTATTAVRARKLPRKSRPGCPAVIPFRIVHHRPPKKKAPAAAPIRKERVNLSVSVILFVLRIRVFQARVGGLALSSYPVPGAVAAEQDTQEHQHERPGVGAWKALIDPDSERRAQQAGEYYRPADESHQAQAAPEIPVPVSLCAELA